MSSKERLTQIENIRALAIFLVVFGHSIILYSSEWTLYETSVVVPWLDKLKYMIDAIQMPLFFSLSGYLFNFTHNKHRGFINLIKSKSLRLLVPYIATGLCYFIPLRILIGFGSYKNIGIIDIITKFWSSSDVGHLWFLPALFLAFIISEIILTLAENIPVIKSVPEMFFCVVALRIYFEGYRIGFGYPPLLGAYAYLIWFSGGYFLSVHKEILKDIYDVKFIKCGLIVINIVLLYIYCKNSTDLSVLFILFFKTLFLVNIYGLVNVKTYPFVRNIARNSFGIYLFHSPLIYITFANIPNAHPAIVVFINLCICGAVALGLTEILRKTKLKIFIGE